MERRGLVSRQGKLFRFNNLLVASDTNSLLLH